MKNFLQFIRCSYGFHTMRLYEDLALLGIEWWRCSACGQLRAVSKLPASPLLYKTWNDRDH